MQNVTACGESEAERRAASSSLGRLLKMTRAAEGTLARVRIHSTNPFGAAVIAVADCHMGRKRVTLML
jgi:hypothetical protein